MKAKLNTNFIKTIQIGKGLLLSQKAKVKNTHTHTTKLNRIETAHNWQFSEEEWGVLPPGWDPVFSRGSVH